MKPNIASIAKLIGDPARASMLTALMGGRALTATELALEADITAQTASSHLARLVQGELLVVRRQGRHKYFQLRGYQVAQLLEALLNVTAGIEHSTIQTGPDDLRLKKARVCYDHLAGEVSVALYGSLITQGILVEKDHEPHLTASGRAFFERLGADLSAMARMRRPVCRRCLDWSERRSHLAGSLGHWLLQDILKRGWASRDLDSRAVTFSEPGLIEFYRLYSVDCPSLIK